MVKWIILFRNRHISGGWLMQTIQWMAESRSPSRCLRRCKNCCYGAIILLRLMGRNFRAHRWRISGNHNICQPLKLSHTSAGIDIPIDMLTGGTCCIFTSPGIRVRRANERASYRGREAPSPEETPAVNSPRRKGLANCWLAGVRVRDENGCSEGRQPNLRLDRKPAGYVIFGCLCAVVTSVSGPISPLERRWLFEVDCWGACRSDGATRRCWVSFIKTERVRISCLSCVRTTRRNSWNWKQASQQPASQLARNQAVKKAYSSSLRWTF